MTCNDILQIKELSELKLIAGRSGLSRTVRWLYFTESGTCVEDIESLGKWVSGGELFVCTNERILENRDFIISMIKTANNLNAAGMVLNVGSIENDYIELAEKLEFPLFEIPWSIRLVDLSQTICTRLIKEQSDENAFERLLNSVIFSHFDSEEEITSNCRYYGFDLARKNRIAIFKIPENEGLPDEEQKSKMRAHFQRCIKSGFKDTGDKKILSMLRHNSVTVLFPEEAYTNDALKALIDTIESHWKYSYNGVVFRVGIGKAYAGAAGAKKSYSEAEKALKLVSIVSDRDIVFYDDLGIYALLFSIGDTAAFETFCHNTLGELIEYDKLNGMHLCETLEVFLEKNKNAAETTEALYIHRNTLRYRLDKIRSLLGKDFDTTEELVNLSMAFKIKKHLELLRISTEE